MATLRLTAEDKRYQASDDLRTLTKAEEIKADKRRHSEAKKEAVRQTKALTKVHRGK
jgi:hypothetical protein